MSFVSFVRMRLHIKEFRILLLYFLTVYLPYMPSMEPLNALYRLARLSLKAAVTMSFSGVQGSASSTTFLGTSKGASFPRV